MRIHENQLGLYVNAFTCLADGTDISGTQYQAVSIDGQTTHINFHTGSIEKGLTGLTTEAVLDILIHRTKAVNEVCPGNHNEHALAHLLMAKEALDNRQADRTERNVLGTKEI